MALTEDEHFEKLRSSGESYLQRALARDVGGTDRGRVIRATMKYLNERSLKSHNRPATSSQAVSFSQAASEQTRDSSFLSTLSASLDFDVDVDVLIMVAGESANLRLLPVLSKCLSILAKKESVTQKKSADDSDARFTSNSKKRKALTEGDGAHRKRKLKGKAKGDELFDDISLKKDDDNANAVEKSAESSDDSQIDSARLFQGRTGQGFVDDFVSKIVQVNGEEGSEVDRTGDVFLASIAREVPLSTSAKKSVLVSLLHRMRTVPLFELPAYVYQTLLFASSKGALSLKKLLLISIAQLFKEIEDNATRNERTTQSLVDDDEDAITSSAVTPKQIRQVQGTTLFHIEYALKQDPALVGELVKLAKANVESQAQFLTPFGIAVLMAVARSPSFQTEVLGHIRDSIVRFEKERIIRERNLFAARVTLNDEELLRPSKSLLEAATRGGGDGWEFISEPFFHFANLLLERPIPGEKSLAIDLMRVLFCAQPSMRKPIMEQISSRIALRGKSATDAIAVLDVLARTVPLDVLELTYFIRQSIEFCVHLPLSLAALLVNAIKPLLRSRRDLLDYFFLVMRKGLFHRESSNRAVAAYGFLNILVFNTEVRSPKSGGTSNKVRIRRRRLSQSGAPLPLSDVDLARIKAASQPLRRALSHPPALRSLFYKEICHFVSNLSKSPERQAACTCLKELLRPHFLKFIDPTCAPYILIDLCVDEASGGILHEPLGDLIQCLSAIESSLSANELQDNYILELARKVATVSLSDFSISKDAPNDVGNAGDEEQTQEQRAEHAAALANRNRTRVLGNVIEALISASLLVSAVSQDAGVIKDIVFPLLDLRMKIIEVLKHLGCATAADAIRELGGDASLEMGYALPFGLKRPGKKGPSNPKKSGKAGKGSKPGADTANNTVSSPSEFRFGAFNILFSAAHSPTIPLSTAMQCLEKMACRGTVPRSDALASFFSEKEDNQNVADLHSYLLAISMKHIQNANEHVRRSGQPLSSSSPSELACISSAICSMSKIAMYDFQRLKHRAAPQTSSDRLHSLQIIEACAKSIGSVFGDSYSVLTELASAMIPDVVADSDNEESSPAYVGLGVVEELIEKLLKDKCFKECLSLLRTYTYFTRCIEGNDRSVEHISSLRQRQKKWASKILSEYSTIDASIVKSLVGLATLYSENNDDMRVAGHVIDRIHVVIGDCDVSAEPPSTEGRDKNSLASALSIQQTTSLAAVDSVLDRLEMALNDVEWCLARMSSLEMSALHAGDNADLDVRGVGNSLLQAEKKKEKIAAQQTIRAEDAAQTRLEGVIRNLQSLASCAVAKWALQERLLRTITRTYKQLSVATNAQVKRKGDPRTSFITMLNACKNLSPILWTYLAFLGTEGGQDVSSKGGKVSKEARIMPQLIYEVELFEKLLISAQKHTRINLLRGMRRNTARDFRIREELLKEPHASGE